MSGTLTVRKTPFVLVAVAMAWFAVPTARADIQFSIHDGRVVLVANDATIADIMAAWAKVGRTTIVNADKIPKDVVTLELRNVSERQVLDILLRTTSGFIAALREVDDPTASLFDRIVIMPPSVAPPPVNASAPPAYPRMPAGPPPSAVSLPEPPVAPVHAAADDTNKEDAPPAVLIGSVLPEQPPESFTSNNTRHMLETLNPRDFHLPEQGRGGVMVPPTAVASPVVGSARPGVISRPASPTAP